MNLMKSTKRLFDILISLLLLPVAVAISCMFGLVFCIVTRENPIFRQTRVGANNVSFVLLKLRTMNSTTAERPTHEIDRSEIPFIGRIMRATKVDELPQLINVLFGDMSIVGPRPCLPGQTSIIEERVKNGVQRLLPGITGYAQVNGIDMSDPIELVKADLYYLKNNRFSMDMFLIFQTVLGHGSGDKSQLNH